MNLPRYLDLLRSAELHLAGGFELLHLRHAQEPDIRDTSQRLARWSLDKARAVQTRPGAVTSRKSISSSVSLALRIASAPVNATIRTNGRCAISRP